MYAKGYGIDLKDVKKLIYHSCDNGLCINSEHLWEWTYKDNIQDMIRKGRSNLKGVGLPTDVYVGETCGYTKLTYKDVLEIRADNTTPYRILGERYGITKPHIYAIKKRIIWKHI